MNIRFHQNFKRQYSKLQKSEKRRFKERRGIFLTDPYNPLLNNHPLKGRYEGYRSINIGGDIRAIYRRLNHETALFVEIGAHGKLYS